MMLLKNLTNRVLLQNNSRLLNSFFHISRQKFHKIKLNRYLATVSTLENIYDIVIVGGGISGSALACALASSSKISESQKRIALIEFSDISSIKEWKPVQGEFSNRVSSLTPHSVRFFQGICHYIQSFKKIGSFL